MLATLERGRVPQLAPLGQLAPGYQADVLCVRHARRRPAHAGVASAADSSPRDGLAVRAARCRGPRRPTGCASRAPGRTARRREALSLHPPPGGRARVIGISPEHADHRAPGPRRPRPRHRRRRGSRCPNGTTAPAASGWATCRASGCPRRDRLDGRPRRAQLHARRRAGPSGPADMAVALARLAELGGGQVAVLDGRVIAEVPLPIGGLMSPPAAAAASAVSADCEDVATTRARRHHRRAVHAPLVPRPVGDPAPADHRQGPRRRGRLHPHRRHRSVTRGDETRAPSTAVSRVRADSPPRRAGAGRAPRSRARHGQGRVEPPRPARVQDPRCVVGDVPAGSRRRLGHEPAWPTLAELRAALAPLGALDPRDGHRRQPRPGGRPHGRVCWDTGAASSCRPAPSRRASTRSERRARRSTVVDGTYDDAVAPRPRLADRRRASSSRTPRGRATTTSRAG